MALIVGLLKIIYFSSFHELPSDIGTMVSHVNLDDGYGRFYLPPTSRNSDACLCTLVDPDPCY